MTLIRNNWWSRSIDLDEATEWCFFGRLLHSELNKMPDNTLNLLRRWYGKMKAPKRVACFMWLLAYCACLAQSNLQKRGMSICGRYYLCNKEEEFRSHLNLHSTVARQLRNLVSYLSTCLLSCFHFERPVDCLGQEGSGNQQEVGGWQCQLYQMGFVDWKKCQVFWRESCICTSVKSINVFGFLVRLTRCKGWKRYVRLRQFTTGIDFRKVRCPSFCFCAGDFLTSTYRALFCVFCCLFQ